jgi:hypothetical protein
MKRLLRVPETTTPTTVAAGPASVDNTKVKTKASQPGCTPVKPSSIATDTSEDVGQDNQDEDVSRSQGGQDDDVNREDSDENKKGQRPRRSASHGSHPSSLSSDPTDQRKDEPPWLRSNSRMHASG